MTGAVLSIAAGFVFIVALLLALSLKTNYHWTIKAGVIALAVGFYAVMLSALPGFYGWPVKESLPQKFKLISMVVQEPDNEASDGVIYMWVADLSDSDQTPRAYELPYDDELHSRLTKARNRMEMGQTLAGVMEPRSGKGSGKLRGSIPRFDFVHKHRPEKVQE